MGRHAEAHDLGEVLSLCHKTGGFVSLTGTSDAIELTERVAGGDEACRLAWDAMIYQIGKAIGSMAVVLEGRVDGILLGGGMAHSEDLVQRLRDTCAWIAPVTAYPGEFEMEAMAAGAPAECCRGLKSPSAIRATRSGIRRRAGSTRSKPTGKAG